jgi:hypothetical protein
MKPTLLLLCCFLLAPAISAQEIRVRTIVKGKPDLEARVVGRINRHLLDWKDVTIVSEPGADLELRIVAIEVASSADGHSYGYALSVVIAQPLTAHEVASLAESYPDNAAFMLSYFGGRSLLDEHYLYLAQPQNLDAQCRAIVEEFNSRHVEPIRKSRRDTRLLEPRGIR